MILANFFKNGNKYKKFDISGHADSAKIGNDLVCAAVTGIVSGTLNAFDQKKCDTEIIVKDNNIVININKNSDIIQNMFDMLYFQLKTIELQYPKNILVKEVL